MMQMVEVISTDLYLHLCRDCIGIADQPISYVSPDHALPCGSVSGWLSLNVEGNIERVEAEQCNAMDTTCPNLAIAIMRLPDA